VIHIHSWPLLAAVGLPQWAAKYLNIFIAATTLIAAPIQPFSQQLAVTFPPLVDTCPLMDIVAICRITSADYLIQLTLNAMLEIATVHPTDKHLQVGQLTPVICTPTSPL